MTKVYTLHVRVTDGHLRKLEEMKIATRLTPSQLVRLLIERAEVERRPQVSIPPLKNESAEVIIRLQRKENLE